MASLVTSMSLSTRVGKRARKVQHARATIGYGRSRHRAWAPDDLRRFPDRQSADRDRRHAAPDRRRRLARDQRRDRHRRTLQRHRSGRPEPRPDRPLPRRAGFCVSRSRPLALLVPASATIHASKVTISGAGSVRFSGRLRTRGTKLPPGGKIVDLQGRRARPRWSTVATTRATGTSGSWHAVARFRGTPVAHPVRLRIRREALFFVRAGGPGPSP